MFSNIKKRTQSLYLLGPALVAGVAYLDPGNVATNLTAGAEFGYMLLWVIVLANTTAWLVQYLSAKLGVVTGKSLPTVLGERFKSKPARILYWIQAELIAMATDVAEVVGGALALYIIFDIPLIYGGLITGAISLAMLGLQGTGRVRGFEFVIIGLVAVTSVGFLAGLFVAPPDPGQVAAGLIPQFDGSESLLLAVGIIGATIMPHAIYAHSALSRDRFPDLYKSGSKERVLRATKWDVSLAMLIAGAVNVGILLVGAVTLFGQAETDSILGAHAAISLNLGEGIALLFALGLLASGLASSSVGAYAGSVIMEGLIKKRVSILVRRSVTLIPALIILSLNVNATQALVLSQVVLSFGIPFALFPLVKLCSDANVMGKYRSQAWVSGLGYLIAGTLSVLNALLIWLSFGLSSPS
jgi:manganese transport protein